MRLEAHGSRFAERALLAGTVIAMVVFVPAVIVIAGVGICVYMALMILLELWRIVSDVLTSPWIWLAAVVFALLSALVL